MTFDLNLATFLSPFFLGGAVAAVVWAEKKIEKVMARSHEADKLAREQIAQALQQKLDERAGALETKVDERHKEILDIVVPIKEQVEQTNGRVNAHDVQIQAMAIDVARLDGKAEARAEFLQAANAAAALVQSQTHNPEGATP